MIGIDREHLAAQPIETVGRAAFRHVDLVEQIGGVDREAVALQFRAPGREIIMERGIGERVSRNQLRVRRIAIGISDVALANGEAETVE